MSKTVVFTGYCWPCGLPLQVRVDGAPEPGIDRPFMPCPVCDGMVQYGWHYEPSAEPAGEAVELPADVMLREVAAQLQARLGWQPHTASRAAEVAVDVIMGLADLDTERPPSG